MIQPDPSTARERAVVLVSGGMDSCVTAAIAAVEHEVAFIHFSYGQRAEAREAGCFEAISEHFGVPMRLKVRLDHMSDIGGSSLTDKSIAVPPADLARAGVPDTYVPFRNAQFLATAASWAETIGATRLFIGAVEEDSSGYPDCRRRFFDRFEAAIEEGTRPETKLKIETPVIGWPKSRIVRAGIDLGAPLHLTWSCYTGDEEACGRCDSCALRARAFREAGLPDPLERP